MPSAVRMEGKKKPDMRYKSTGIMVLVVFLASLYVLIALSTTQNHVTCLPHSWQTDAYQIDRKLQVEVTYKKDREELSRISVKGAKATNDHHGAKQPGQRGAVLTPRQECTAAELQRRASTVVLTTTNNAFLDMTENWLASIRRTRACPNITVVAEDQQAYRFLSRKAVVGLHIQQTGSGLSTAKKLVFNTKEYKKFVNKRQRYILRFLEQGWEVLFSDVDTFWLRDPFPFLQGNFDMALEVDEYRQKGKKGSFYCAGFVYFRPTERTLRFVREWIRFMEADEKLRPDQVVMNLLIAEKKVPRLKLQVLNSDRFPNGKLFFNETWRRDKRGIVVVHNNWIIGHDPKVERFRNNSMWLVDKNIKFPSS
ncbi:UDP-D-xylose:L-fucose alpha-1,3-D-xylosyltransferase 1-like [Acanthaster planci]|uniref:UDP-D-xylose:L-fucose alpha-1,3-D-xylosyltransferase 1-like n=1 Tax=Acanthaster planci TaxID=133434 RepID=A0A8B7XWT3_ACAPL|nr:UDP-D-xylose:L-fucose alpha-1,3-D-xylosyltransferase 1-like [Acanthaster planci]